MNGMRGAPTGAADACDLDYPSLIVLFSVTN
jgi:hypothetical protein